MNEPDGKDTEETTDTEEMLQQLYQKWGSLQSVRLSFFERLVESMRGFSFYRVVLLEDGKQAFFYYLKLCLLLGALSGTVFGYTSYQMAGEVSEALQNQIPEVTIKNGKVSVDAETPYRMQLPRDFEVILDPDAELNRLRLETKVLAVLVKSSLYVRNTPDSFESWPLSTFLGNTEGQTITITGQTIADWTTFIQRSMFIMSLIIMLLFVLIQTGFWVLIISIGGMIASESPSPLFSWSTFTALSCYAVTPIAIARSFLFMTGINLQFQRYLLLGAGTVFVYFIVKYLEQRITKISFESPDEGPITKA